MFAYCSSLLFVPYISKWNVDRVYDMSYFFYKCISLLFIPDITKWNISKVKKLNSFFAYCSSLQRITMPDSIISIGVDVFYDCKSLQQIIIPENCVEKFKKLLPVEIWDKLYCLQRASNDCSDDCCFTIF